MGTESLTRDPSAFALPSADEASVRIDLAACYRLIALYGWDDLIFTHISARIAGSEHFLINPFGMLFEEITASSLVRVDADGVVVGTSPYPINPAGFTIHSAVHEARPDVGCMIHLHTADGIAVSTLAEGLLPISQTGMLAGAGLAYHDYEGVALDLDERGRLQADLGTNGVMILRNHGTLSVGSSVAEAFLRIYFLEQACTAQVRALSMGRPLHAASDASIEKSHGVGRMSSAPVAQLAWPALLRKLDRELPGYADELNDPSPEEGETMSPESVGTAQDTDPPSDRR